VNFQRTALAAFFFLICAGCDRQPSAAQPVLASEAWKSGFVDATGDQVRWDRFQKDTAKADLEVRVTGDDQLDVGIGPIKNGGRIPVTFSMDELKYFFELQKHKGFVVVTYDKAAPAGELVDSLKRLKTYFASAGYKRILLLHAHSSGSMIHEDYRPTAPANK
jgi:hypothetical protein